jgi:hypothetical protein
MEGLKKKMTYDEMVEVFRNNSLRSVNKVNVGMFAKSLGFHVYKPMIKGRICHFYINEKISLDGNKTK